MFGLGGKEKFPRIPRFPIFLFVLPNTGMFHNC